MSLSSQGSRDARVCSRRLDELAVPAGTRFGTGIGISQTGNPAIDVRRSHVCLCLYYEDLPRTRLERQVLRRALPARPGHSFHYYRRLGFLVSFSFPSFFSPFPPSSSLFPARRSSNAPSRRGDRRDRGHRVTCARSTCRRIHATHTYRAAFFTFHRAVEFKCEQRGHA